MSKLCLMAVLTAAFVAASSTYAITADQTLRKIETVAKFSDAMPTGVAVSAEGRIFVNYPRWGDKFQLQRSSRERPSPFQTWRLTNPISCIPPRALSAYRAS